GLLLPAMAERDDYKDQEGNANDQSDDRHDVPIAEKHGGEDCRDYQDEPGHKASSFPNVEPALRIRAHAVDHRGSAGAGDSDHVLAVRADLLGDGLLGVSERVVDFRIAP